MLLLSSSLGPATAVAFGLATAKPPSPTSAVPLGPADATPPGPAKAIAPGCACDVLGSFLSLLCITVLNNLNFITFDCFLFFVKIIFNYLPCLFQRRHILLRLQRYRRR